MYQPIKDYLASFEFGELQRYKNMAAFPLLTLLDHSQAYITLKEALEKKLLKITEVSREGSVPDLKAANSGDSAVLLLDGEEVAGAKQNRVLNTTILIKEKSEVIIPVSCTEQGRWAYVAEGFQDSGVVMSPVLRKMKNVDVATSLSETGEYRSDQGKIWDTIHRMADETRTESRTAAMTDVFKKMREELDEYLKAFSPVPHQKGLLVFVGGAAEGFDFISLEKPYQALHPKLVKSYAMEAILKAAKKEEKEEKGTPEEPVVTVDEARKFLDEASQCSEKKYESVGKGWDWRFEGKEIVGSALEVEDKVIHMAFFRITESEKAGTMAGTRRRRGFRV